MSRRKPHFGQCAYCGCQGVMTRDHVIPRALFRPPYPTNPVVVDAYCTCNKLKAQHEDYLRDFLTLDYRGSQRQTAQKVFDSKVRRSHARNSSELIKKAMDSVRVEPIYSRAGVYLGHFPQAYVDDGRLFQVLGMIVRGLYCDARKERLPDNCRVIVNRHDPWDYPAVYEAFDLPSRPASRAVGGVFRCAFRRATEEPSLTLWLFYNRVLFSPVTEPTTRSAPAGA